jgi:signal transduction histidine kinase
MGKEMQERKDQLISLISHYMLNPITIIQTAVNRLQNTDSKDIPFEEKEVLYNAIMSGQQRLWILTEQIILVGEIDEGTLKLNIGVGDLAEVVDGAIIAVDPFAREKKIKFNINEQQQVIWESRMDASRIKQALIAILDNAIKFSQPGGVIDFSIQLDGTIFTLTIEDQGIGMPEEVTNHLSERFFRGNDIYNFDYEGVGLGLHIAEAIISLHEGRITINSRAKRGTTVTIQFPKV